MLYRESSYWEDHMRVGALFSTLLLVSLSCCVTACPVEPPPSQERHNQMSGNARGRDVLTATATETDAAPAETAPADTSLENATPVEGPPEDAPLVESEEPVTPAGEDLWHRLRVPLEPPYSFLVRNRDDPDSEPYVSHTRYLAYVTGKYWECLATSRDIYLAVDADEDGGYDEVLATGLRDFSTDYIEYSCEWGAGADDSYEVLPLEVDGDEVRITHHIALAEDPHPVYSEFGIIEPPSIAEGLQTSTLSLAELRRDSDGDGLTDILEEQLLIDPHNPDTDRDGIEDYYDPQPNVDPATMGRLERGISRALSREDLMQKDYQPGSGPTKLHPWRGAYDEIVGAGAIAGSYTPYGFGISLNSPEAMKQYRRLAGFDRGSAVQVRIVDMSEAQPDKVEKAIDCLSADYYAQQPDTPADCEYVLVVYAVLNVFALYLADREGELYEVKLKWLCGG